MRSGRPKSRPNKTSCSKTSKQLGITRDQSSKWQRLAEIPDDQFEDLLQSTDYPRHIPSTQGILRKAGKRRASRGTQKMGLSEMAIADLELLVEELTLELARRRT